ncbi:TetR family transcriptional regulator [Amycolatopsis sp. TNS106]|uniref:TetR/AcrR family transcriptional regulator n=1 Tax=Amycolatopsis sp. TNS106 TaxID=2861750 RepID=UPI001C5954E6|nr:TetR family transcriptional regulator [Amycolatopsis sp. TNS106]QXV62263.1 TetR family transcriptional regulator [Amycolatopsis sp. TNS106]
MRRSSEQTKAAILRAARDRFSADGYDRATVRAIAAAADIDPSMVMRYFGSKRELFAKAADLDLKLPDLTTVPRDEVGRALAGHLIDRWEGDDALRILLRTAMTDEDASAKMQKIFAGQLTPLIARFTDDPVDAATRAGLAASQALGLALCRYVIRLPPVAALSREEVVEWVGPTLQRYLAGPR